MRLVDTVKGENRRGRMTDDYLRAEVGVSPPEPYGITVDGVRWVLDGQPPVAVSHGWGARPGG